VSRGALRVAVNARLEAGRAGGIQRGVEALATALAAAPDPDQEVTFVVWAGLDGWLDAHAGGAGIRRHHAGRGMAPGAAAALRGRRWARPAVRAALHARNWLARPAPPSAALRRLGPDVVHFPYQDAELTGRPYLYQPWDLQHRWLPQMFEPSERHRRQALYRRFCEGAAFVVVATGWIRRDVCAAFDVDPERVVVVPPWGPSGRPAGGPAPAEGLPLAGLSGPYAVFPAQAWPHKGHATLLEAIALLRDSGLAVPVVLPGATNDRVPALRARAEALGIGPLVRFPGYVDDATLQAMVSRARCLVFPSQFEGWGYPIVEAFDAGTPVVCSDHPSLADTASGAAATFATGDPPALARVLAEVWTDADLRRRLAEAGRQRVGALSWAATGRAYRRLYRAAAEGSTLATPR
jgi:glycosyltransferase involved in cell wall biosynthesis